MTDTRSKSPPLLGYHGIDADVVVQKQRRMGQITSVLAYVAAGFGAVWSFVIQTHDGRGLSPLGGGVGLIVAVLGVSFFVAYLVWVHRAWALAQRERPATVWPWVIVVVHLVPLLHCVTPGVVLYRLHEEALARPRDSRVSTGGIWLLVVWLFCWCVLWLLPIILAGNELLANIGAGLLPSQTVVVIAGLWPLVWTLTTALAGTLVGSISLQLGGK